MQTEVSYLNPWSPYLRDSEREFKTRVKPVQHRGFKIYQRIPNSFEVVKDGVCVAQRAGLEGAKRAIDNLLDNPSDFWAQRMAGYMASHSSEEAAST
jgi:hypothetical protein